MGVEVGVEVDPPGRFVGVGVFVELPGILVGVSVAEGCVAVGVAVPPRIVNVSVTNGMSVRVLFPCETRALHSIVVCPACKPFTLNVNTVPLVVALLPSLAATATIKLCAPGPFTTDTVSGPKREAT